jgi:hypothetical protein
MTAKQALRLVFGALLAYAVLCACLLAFWWTTALVLGAPLP